MARILSNLKNTADIIFWSWTSVYTFFFIRSYIIQATKRKNLFASFQLEWRIVEIVAVENLHFSKGNLAKAYN